MSQLPNALSLLRLLSAPLLAYLVLQHNPKAALALALIAGLSDLLDGSIARYFGASSTLGRYLDPAADKAMLVTAFVSLGVTRQIEYWLVALVLLRDVVIITGSALLYQLRGTRDFSPVLAGKISTGFQILTVLVVLVFAVWPSEPLALVREATAFACAIFTGISGFVYIRKGIALARRKPA